MSGFFCGGGFFFLDIFFFDEVLRDIMVVCFSFIFGFVFRFFDFVIYYG